MQVRKVLGITLLTAGMIATGWSAEPSKEKPVAGAATEKKQEWKEDVVETAQSVKIKGKELRYKTTTGNILLKEKGEVKANVFYVAYTKSYTTDLLKRPITFCFNGGPGSSSVWLHIGALGPRRLVVDEEGTALLPYRVEPNDESLLDVTDLVFIDPVSTGYSRAATEEEAKQYHGVEEDIKSVAEFIRLYVTRNNRWGSPKYLAGESYGTTRAAGLSLYLHDEFNMTLNGLLLVSSALNYQSFDFKPGNDLPYITFLPSYTAVAWYHHKLPPELQANLATTLKEVENFASQEYALALLKGDALTPEESKKIAEKVARYTGLSPEYVQQQNLRVNVSHFGKELLRQEGAVISRFDGRIKGLDFDKGGELCSYDPSLEVLCGAFTAAFNQYVRNELKWETDEDYKVLTNVFPWNFGKATNQYLNMNDSLREVMTKNSHLKVLVACGLYDLATAYGSARYTFGHLQLDPALRNHVKLEYYDAGHMMFLHKPSLIKLKQDTAAFIQSSQ